MVRDSNLQFVREKIIQLRHAVMYATSNGLVKPENDVVTAVDVDDEGHLWFTADKLPRLIDAYDKCFPARLRFYRKSLEFWMEISGKATIVNCHYYVDDDNSFGNKKIPKLLVKLNMTNIEYTEAHVKR